MQIEFSNKRARLLELIRSQRIAKEDVQNALLITQVYPDKRAWFLFIDGLFLWLGALALVCACIFFVAANWQHLGRVDKFVLLQGVVCIPVLAYWRWYSRKYIRQIALIVATIAVGGLMAFFGQTYQTGADPWQLFCNWALVVTPWVVIARSNILWLTWLGLLNLALWLYFESGSVIQWRSHSGAYFSVWALFVFNLLALAIWQVRNITNLNSTRWPIQILAISVLSLCSTLAFYGIFDHQAGFGGVAAWSITLGAGYWLYRRKLPDLVILAAGGLSLISVVNAIFIRIVPDRLMDLFFVVIAISILAMGVAIVHWLKAVAKEVEGE